jgi:hypothetical protein
VIAAIVLSGLLDRMAAVNADLHAYTATLHAQISLTTFPFLQTEITGTLYRKEPDRERLTITSGMPLLAQQFGNLYPQIVGPSHWRSLFVVALSGEGNGIAHLRLVPRVGGNVLSIDADVDEATALVSRFRWNYRNGGYAELAQQYARVGDDRLPVSQQGHIQEPGYVADITATIDRYHLNPSLPDSVFTQ